MLKAELQKTWSRPLIIVAFLLACLAQVIYVSMNYDSGTKELSDAYNTFGGQMDDAWRDSIYAQYEQLRLKQFPPSLLCDALHGNHSNFFFPGELINAQKDHKNQKAPGNHILICH